MKKIEVSHILVRHAYEAEDVLRLLREGHSFQELAMKMSLCPSSTQGGSLGLISVDRLHPDFAEELLKLKAGQISRPTRTPFGYHLILRHC